MNKLSKAPSSKSKKSSKKKSKKKVKAKAKKLKKSTKGKQKRKRKHDTSSSSSDSDSDSSSDSSSGSDSSSSSDSDRKKKTKRNRRRSDDEWVESAPVPVEAKPLVQRDSWMTDSAALTLKTFSKERKEPMKPNAMLQQIDAYDPAKNIHELNPYWKSNGTGLPGFQKPKADDEDDEERPVRRTMPSGSSSRNWQKSVTSAVSGRESAATTVTGSKIRSSSPKVSGSSSRRRSPSSASSSSSEEESEGAPKPLTDEQINELAAKAIKAELKGKPELAAEFNKQLDMARKLRAEHLASGKPLAKSKSNSKSEQKREHVLLTRTDASGNVRPLLQSKTAVGHKTDGKRQKKKVETHSDGQRVRYFADDDRYDIKQMVKYIHIYVYNCFNCTFSFLITF